MRVDGLIATRPHLAADVLAGVTVAIVLIPQSLAYAQLAGMPAYRGLYAAALPPLVAAFLASSPYLQTGPVTLTALLTFGSLSELAPPGSDEYVELGILLALVVGAVRLLLGLVGAGVIAYLVSQPMLLGVVPAAAVLIVASQLPIALGAVPPEEGILEGASWTLAHPGAVEIEALVLVVVVLGLVAGGRFVHPLFPSVLLAVLAGIAYSKVADYGGATVGPIPGTFPPFSLDMPWEEILSLVIPGIVIAVVGFVEPASIARRYAALDRKAWNPNRELVSQGAANVAAAVSGGFPVGGSFSRSALNRTAGARTRWSGAVTGITVLAFLPLAGSLSSLPRAVLAAILIGAVASLLRPLPLVRLARLSRPQFLVAAATFALTLVLAPHVERAVLIGILLAVAVHLWRELQLEVPHWVEEETLHLRPRGVLWFGTAPRLEDTFLALIGEHTDAKRLLVHLDGLGRIDMTGALALRGLLQQARESGLAVDLVDVRPRWDKLVENVISQEQDPLGRGTAS